MSFDIKDLAGLSQPLTKLIEVVSSAIGTQFRPGSVVRGADARAYEIRAIARAEAEAEEIRRTVKLDAIVERIGTATGGDAELIARARQRLLAREIDGQLNIEAIANSAVSSLASNVSEDPVSKDWRRKFFLHAENVCEGDMQFLWGKVLAGETASSEKPKSKFLSVPFLAEQEREVAVHSKGVGGMKELRPGHNTGAVLSVEIDQGLGPVQLGVLAAGDPEGGVEARIERVVNGEKVSDVVPGLGVEAVVQVDEGRRGFAEAVEQ